MKTFKLKSKWQHLAQKLFINYLQLTPLNSGKLILTLPDLRQLTFEGKEKGVTAQLLVCDNRFFSAVIFQGDIGLGESYMNRWIETDCIETLLTFFIQNPSLTAQGSGLIPSLNNFKDYILHLLNDNRITQNKKNIEAHYDLGNDFYQRFLDSSLMYSSAIFSHQQQSLEEAQQNKLDHLIQKAKISAEHHVLEIGSGWGSFAIRAAKTTGCRVTTITLSSEQKKKVEERILAEGLESKVTVKLIDYRLQQGKFDRIVSIEMIEAVGHRHLKSYVAQLENLLAPHGLVVIQMISMPDYRYNRYLKSVDWIRKYIFPGGHLPSLSAFSKVMENHSKFYFESVENIAPHYAMTLRHWNDNFQAEAKSYAEQKYGDRFCRMWEYYLLSCAAAFSTRYINTHVLLLSRDQNVTLDQSELRHKPAMKVETQTPYYPRQDTPPSHIH